MNTRWASLLSKLKHYGPSLIVMIWTVVAIALSSQRSLWQDELMRYQQMQMSLLDALKSLYAEPSPFAPGEIILGLLSKTFFSWFTPFELWARLPAILFGFLTLTLTLSESSVLYTLMMALSVSIVQFSTQYRPYSAMMFNAALTFKLMFPLLFRGQPPKRTLYYFGLIFGHIYGICFQTMGALAARRFKDALISVVYLTLVLGAYALIHHGTVSTWTSGFGPMNYNVILSWLYITAGASNHVSDVLLPFAVIGLALLLYRGRALAILHVLAFIFAVIVCPIIANIVGNYFFAPRQLIGAVFPFITLAWYGIKELHSLIPKKFSIVLNTVTFLILVIMTRAWGVYVFDGRPPYAEQPLHKHKQRISYSLEQLDHNVLLLDPGGTAYFYYELALGKPITEFSKSIGPYHFVVRTWPNYTLYHFDDAAYAWKDLNELTDDAEFNTFINGSTPKFDRILYNAYKLELKTTVPSVRLW